MASDPAGQGNDASLSEEEAMANYMGPDLAQQDEELTNGIYRHNKRNSQRGYPKPRSIQGVYKYQCKYMHSLPRRPYSLHVVECKVTFVRWALWALDSKSTFITTCFGCLI
jgi:hypothetical protein